MGVSRLHRGWHLLRYLGPSWLAYRMWHAVRLNSGLMRRQLPVATWEQQPLHAFLNIPSLADPQSYAAQWRERSTRFFFNPRDVVQFHDVLAQWDDAGSGPVAQADELTRGIVQFFSHEQVEVGAPPRWHVDPFSQFEFPADRHWSQIGDFGAGDIKLVWEPNRFGFVFALVRAYLRTRDERYAELFWHWIEDWRHHNAPQAGCNWKCGQEISLRVMAWCFGMYGLASSPASTSERIAILAQMIAVSGRRIEANIDYALSQQNNHGLSESMGLWTIGALFPEFKASTRWAATGRRLLEEQACSLIYDDGTFSQHSMNYHRVMLQDYIWSIRLGDVLGQPFSDQLRHRIGKAGEFLYQLQDIETGRVPMYGQDDGALILPLNNCGYRDYRPVVQATHFVTTGQRRLPAGPWDEDLLWLFNGEPLRPTSIEQDGRAEQPERISDRTDFEAPNGGYVTLRSKSGFAMTRAASFQHRPAQADMLHVDLWWRGENIAIDAGTYSYNSSQPWNNGLAHTVCHNTVSVDDLDQMDRAGRFLWLPWLTGRSFQHSAATRGDIAFWNGEHDGYRRLSDPVVHRRGFIRLGSEHWCVIDALHGDALHSYRLHWLLCDAPYEWNTVEKIFELNTAEGLYRVAMQCSAMEAIVAVIRAADNSVLGWRSTHYHSREPALSVSLTAQASRIVFATVFGPDAQQASIEGDVIHLRGRDWNGRAMLNLSTPFGVPLITSVEVGGSLLNPLTTNDIRTKGSLQESLQCTFC